MSCEDSCFPSIISCLQPPLVLPATTVLPTSFCTEQLYRQVSAKLTNLEKEKFIYLPNDITGETLRNDDQLIRQTTHARAPTHATVMNNEMQDKIKKFLS